MFNDFKKVIKNKLDFLIKNSGSLFEVNIDKDQFWDLYLDSFPDGTNEIYRERRQYDCSCCRQFIKNYGSIVGIIDGQMVSVWDVEIEAPFQVVANALKTHIESLPIANVFYSKFAQLGTDYNHELINDQSHKWEHFYYKLPSALVSSNSKSIESLQGAIRQTKDVIKRSFEELTPSVIGDVLELIAEKSLYKGEENKTALESFQKLQKGFIVSKNKDNYCWGTAVKHGRVAAIRNTAIGTLLINLSGGMDLDLAVKKYESVVAPSNYKRPKAIFTKSMREAAEKKVSELGFMESLQRRYAKVDDISIKDVIWASGESKKVMKTPFDLLESDEKVSTKKLDHLEEVGIEYFLENLLPNAETLEVLVDNSHRNNFVSLITAKNEDSKSMFKWGNNFSWSYNGDFTDSIKESVKKRGGKVDGDLRFSLSWAEGNSDDNSDLDAHCILPNGSQIYYSNSHDMNSGGSLDVDIQQPRSKRNKDIVENITWPSRNKMPKGNYKFFVRNYALRGQQKGFTAELEYDGKIHTFTYDKPLRNGEDVQVVTVNFDGANFTIKKSLPSTQASKQVWGVSTMKYVPVSAFMFSPNFWSNKTEGNRHYFFMLQGCVNEGTPRGFFNEYLKNDLIEHKRVFEALGAKMKVEHTENQLSGLGFSSTMQNSVVVKINSKPVKINFTDDRLILKSSKKQATVSN